jgi:chromosome partitioning protein
MLKIAGIDTHLVDCDRQQSAQRLATRRMENQLSPPVVCTALSGSQLQIPLADLAAKYDAVVIDCGGQDSVELRASMVAPSVSLMIIPIQAGYFDLETLLNMDSLVASSQAFNRELDAKCLINRAPTHFNMSVVQDTKALIQSEFPHLGLWETVLHDRVNYGYAVATGECVVEYEFNHKVSSRQNKASIEMLALFEEVTGMKFPLDKLSPFSPVEEMTA